MGKTETSYTETQTHFYAIAAGIWGRGRDEAEAVKNMKASGSIGDRYLVYKVPPGTTFYTDGSFGTPMNGPQTTLIKRVRKINRRWVTEEVSE